MQYDPAQWHLFQDIKKFIADPKPEADEKPAEAAWSDEPSEVVHLTDDTFDSFMADNPSVLIMFYAPWCGHCQMMEPDWEEVGQYVTNNPIHGVDLTVAEVRRVCLYVTHSHLKVISNTR